MGTKKQRGQQTAEKKKRKITFGKILALVFGVAAVVYMSFSVHVFYNFIKIMITNPDEAKQQGAAVEALDEIYTDEEE